MPKSPQEQVSDITNSMANILLNTEGVRGVVVTIDWDDAKNPHLGMFRVRETSLNNVLELLRRTAMMQSHILGTLNRLTGQTTVLPKKEDTDGRGSIGDTRHDKGLGG